MCISLSLFLSLFFMYTHVRNIVYALSKYLQVSACNFNFNFNWGGICPGTWVTGETFMNKRGGHYRDFLAPSS